MKNKILPIITILMVVLAIFVVIFTSKDKDNKEDELETDIAASNKSGNEQKFILNENGDIEIKSEDLDLNNATFINYETENGYIVELIVVKDNSNNIDVAFNTCQVCNGSPKAYFVQKNGNLICENCGNMFPLTSVGQAARGCNPMTLTDKDITRTENGITISKKFLTQNEKLFTNVEKH